MLLFWKKKLCCGCLSCSMHPSLTSSRQKMMDGTRSGLQEAHQLKAEIEAKKKRDAVRPLASFDKLTLLTRRKSSTRPVMSKWERMPKQFTVTSEERGSTVSPSLCASRPAKKAKAKNKEWRYGLDFSSSVGFNPPKSANPSGAKVWFRSRTDKTRKRKRPTR